MRPCPLTVNFRGVAYCKLHVEVASEDAKRAVVRKKQKTKLMLSRAETRAWLAVVVELAVCLLSRGHGGFPNLRGCKYTTHNIMKIAVGSTACVHCTAVVHMSEYSIIRGFNTCTHEKL